ncbi:signal peptidase I [Longicatena caecimuris]|uniref:Signal peptidase I n=1 Tax=Longicatena caecimuris TaxID=1796635 RepID=A0A4R3TFL7_9FIRM|nr:signal peptidase I [Longicatena caecimuris]MCR1870089.1 signal peptidase I [Longicatena caecimuris]MCU0102527.1 signal peptidase I [Longicatena caecimuris]TCU60159.1 signal peptidase [Longicatena caecimuris]
MKKISNILSTLLLIVVVILACIFFVPRLFGIQTMAVLSGSMEPHFHVGSLVFVKDAEITDFEKDDIVTFKIGNGDTVVTHRVTQVTKKGLKTKGDANHSEDGGLVTSANLVGKAFSFSIPVLGYLAVYMSSQTGIILLIGAIILVFVLSYIGSLFDKKEKGAN